MTREEAIERAMQDTWFAEMVNDLRGELKAKDERIAELEAMVQKMKCCENCNDIGIYRSVFCVDCGSDFVNWQLKDNK